MTLARALAQAPMAPPNDLPNPHQTIENYFKLPEGRTVGIHECGGHRQGRPLRLGRRALRCE
jgi:hypothetical protein